MPIKKSPTAKKEPEVSKVVNELVKEGVRMGVARQVGGRKALQAQTQALVEMLGRFKDTP